MKFNEKVVKLRKLKGLTQDEFAAAVGVSRQAVYKWESGQSYPEVPKLLEMKLLFGISLDDLLDESYEVVMPEKTKRKRISREKKAEIEAVVNSALKEETEKEEVPAEAPAEEPALVVENSTPDETPALAAEEAKEDLKPEVNEEKKRGFFGRLFGRK